MPQADRQATNKGRNELRSARSIYAKYIGA